MNTDNIGGRKFIAYLLSMTGWGACLFVTVMNGLLTGELIQIFLFFLVLIQGIFFGGNLIENYINKKLGTVDNTVAK